MDSKTIAEQLKSFIGTEVGRYTSWNPVNQPMIRQWCQALDDNNPLYERGFAPPPMMMSWALRDIHGRLAPGSSKVSPFAPLELLSRAGFTKVVAVSLEQSFDRYLRIDDEVSYISTISNISERKTTRLGEGYYVTQQARYQDAVGEPVGQMSFTVLAYKANTEAQVPATAPVPAERHKWPRPLENHDSKFFWDGVREGELRAQQCANGHLRHPPSPMCPICQSLEWRPVELSGRGSLHSYVIAHHPPIPPFRYPNPIGLVDLEEGIRFIAQLRDVRREDLQIGMPLEVFFEEVEPGLTLPHFRPAATIGRADVKAGDSLAPLEIPITATLVVGGALATLDFEPIHHDHDAAVAAGAPDVIMNIITTSGLVSRYLTDRLGDEYRLDELKMRIAHPNCPGDRLILSATVAGVRNDGETRFIDLEFRGDNREGNSVLGTAVLKADPQGVIP